MLKNGIELGSIHFGLSKEQEHKLAYRILKKNPVSTLIAAIYCLIVINTASRPGKLHSQISELAPRKLLPWSSTKTEGEQQQHAK